MKPQTAREAIQLYLDRELEDQAFYAKIRETLAPFDGKQITKRLATAVEKSLSCRVHYDPGSEYLSSSLSIWGGETGIEFKSRATIYLAQHKGDEFSLPKFDEHNSRYANGTPTRIQQCETILATNQPESMDKLASDVRCAIADYSVMLRNSYDNPAYYRILEAHSIPHEAVR